MMYGITGSLKARHTLGRIPRSGKGLHLGNLCSNTTKVRAVTAPGSTGDTFRGRGVHGFVFKQYPVLGGKEGRYLPWIQGLGCKESSPSGCRRFKGITGYQACRSPHFPLLLPLKISPGCPLPAPSANPEQLYPSAAAVELSGSCGAEQNNEKGSLYQQGQ